MTTLQDISKKQKELDDFIQEHGKKALSDSLSEFLNKYADVKCVKWTQYSPHFNDGDPCTFSVNEPELFFNDNEGAEEEDEDDENEGYSSWRLGYCKEKNQENSSKITDEMIKDFDILSKLICDNEDVCESVFGDGYEITATKEGITAKEYDHD